MIDAARDKAKAASVAAGLPVGLGSEGAYGAHPLIPFLAWGKEILLWHDSRTGHEIMAHVVDEAPIYDHIEVIRPDEAHSFLLRIGFPATAVIVAPADARNRPVAKGVQDMDHLAMAIRTAASGGRALIQTDMRAHLNARRMSTIQKLADRFAHRLAKHCDCCGARVGASCDLRRDCPVPAVVSPASLRKAKSMVALPAVQTTLSQDQMGKQRQTRPIAHAAIPKDAAKNRQVIWTNVAPTVSPVSGAVITIGPAPVPVCMSTLGRARRSWSIGCARGGKQAFILQHLLTRSERSGRSNHLAYGQHSV
ncbi:MAG: DUF6671 family protein [bacterium]